jgi:hypothetical protein
VHSNHGPLHFKSLQQALARAEEHAADRAREMAVQAGAADIEILVDHAANHVRHDIDGDLFLESRVTATATGRPALAARS